MVAHGKCYACTLLYPHMTGEETQIPICKAKDQMQYLGAKITLHIADMRVCRGPAHR